MITYLESGVNITAGDEFVRRITEKVRSTHSSAVLNDIGGFGAFYDLKLCGLKSPVLVASTDGVGTKVKVAFLVGKHDTIGVDLVHHCINDIAVCGARPLFFLDYIAMGKLNRHVAEEIISGMVRACRSHSCALVGGETAEMPDIYRDNEYDVAGCIVGIVERGKIFDGSKIRAKDVLIGIPSSGLHTNGYSLARRVLFERFDCEDFIDELGMNLGDALLSEHRSYYHLIQALINEKSVHGFSHITGGGLSGNISRLLSKNLFLNIDWNAWVRPQIFNLIQKYGDVPEDDMRRTFNLGIGLVIICSSRGCDKICRIVEGYGEKPIVIGEIKKYEE